MPIWFVLGEDRIILVCYWKSRRSRRRNAGISRSFLVCSSAFASRTVAVAGMDSIDAMGCSDIGGMIIGPMSALADSVTIAERSEWLSIDGGPEIIRPSFTEEPR